MKYIIIINYIKTKNYINIYHPFAMSHSREVTRSSESTNLIDDAEIPKIWSFGINS